MNFKSFSRLRLFLPVLGITLFCSAAVTTRAEELTWQTNFAQASTDAAQQHKYMLLDFTGSDWCPWCIKMDKEVFSQPKFSEFALKNLILVRLDFPRRTPQSAAEKSQNEGLAQKYGIEGFPTYLLLDSTGKEVRRQVGYLQGGTSAFINWLGLSG